MWWKAIDTQYTGWIEGIFKKQQQKIADDPLSMVLKLKCHVLNVLNIAFWS